MQFARTLPKELVHRAAIAEVFLTDAERLSEDETLLAAQLPRLHPFYDDVLGPRTHHDPLLLLEACRQGIYVVAHRHLDVPLGHRFLLRTVEFEVPDPAALVPGDSPTEAVIGVRVEHRIRSRSGVTGLRLRFTVAIGTRQALLARIEYSWMPAQDWTRLRAGQRDALGLSEPPVALPGPRVDPALVGRRNQANVVVSAPYTSQEGVTTARLVAETSHPTLYDHWVDHVPGMVELEAFRQLALTAAVAAGTVRTPTALPVGLSVRFRRFAEMDLPLECRAAPVLPGADIECTLHQPGALVAEARVRLAERTAAGLTGVLAGRGAAR
ncbi:ScbA/BarX family gamma-butyrolactone biosynthesis protein [Streptomyces sp. HD]|uniref:ScbA/BarX family gamma-butyrolactone biosynthesis protein n=1 Tax=Streptomyces sp. HD TaxID=3020892 RepID=UPI00232FA9C1|nr:ScbA/BarX family gamma-butyrolactone biosynthesis protein [Streptomyces sp. HD]MDC0773111.1 ScbA/BarX family gamma-butyrolactone biosynthesis protein [Streptomyces sp. HD]